MIAGDVDVITLEIAVIAGDVDVITLEIAVITGDVDVITLEDRAVVTGARAVSTGDRVCSQDIALNNIRNRAVITQPLPLSILTA